MKYMDWNEFGDLCEQLYDKIKMRNYDGIIGIGRGGTIVAGILAAKLGTRVYSVFVLHKGTGEQKSTTLVDLRTATGLASGRYLLVDDKCITGYTFELIKEALVNSRIETAALICTSNGYHPDLTAILLDDDIHFPYQ